MNLFCSFAFIFHCDHDLICLMNQIQCTDEYGICSAMDEKKKDKIYSMCDELNQSNASFVSHLLSLFEVLLQCCTEFLWIFHKLFFSLFHRLLARRAWYKANHFIHRIKQLFDGTCYLSAKSNRNRRKKKFIIKCPINIQYIHFFRINWLA